MVVITIVAILMGIGVPSFKYVTTANRVSSEVNGLLGDLQFARSEAIKEGQTVSACASADGATCSGSPTTAAAWQGGWIVFSDPPGTGISPATTNAVLRVQKGFSSQDTFQAGAGAVTFNREGFANLASGTLTLTLHDSTNNQAWTRCLSIATAGLMATQTHVKTPSCQ
jgi:type IV fimbrial biogenesis protein FimT